jgi:hypothetical protein
MDGESILGTLQQHNTAPWRSSFLLERGKMTFQRYAKVGFITAFHVRKIN